VRGQVRISLALGANLPGMPRWLHPSTLRDKLHFSPLLLLARGVGAGSGFLYVACAYCCRYTREAPGGLCGLLLLEHIRIFAPWLRAQPRLLCCRAWPCARLPFSNHGEHSPYLHRPLTMQHG